MNNLSINISKTIVKTTIISITSFKIQSIMINFNDIAVVYCMIYGTTDNDTPYERNLAVPVPFDVYCDWSYNSDLIISFCKDYIEKLSEL